MEKLIVKNFGPIKEAEIDLTKYVVFIGDTSTGKSVLAKLISIFREFSFFSFHDILNEFNFSQELRNFNIDFDLNNSRIDYYDFDVHLQLYGGEVSVVNDGREKSVDGSGFLFERVVYFPAERILTSLVGSSISGLWANNVALPSCFKDFSAKYEVARKRILKADYSSFGFNYTFEKGEDRIVMNENSFLLTQASSGIQSLLPLLLVLDDNLRNYETCFLIEEPELNLFPIKQKKLIDYIVKGVNKTKYKVVFTTHSPYILSSLDTLMLAKNTFNEHPDLKEEITAIVSEDKWIDYDDISVYEVRNDGKVYSIKNEEFRSIDTNAIDGVSDIISEEFDKLTELRYAH
jgi:hypothetical protein